MQRIIKHKKTNSITIAIIDITVIPKLTGILSTIKYANSIDMSIWKAKIIIEFLPKNRNALLSIIELKRIKNNEFKNANKKPNNGFLKLHIDILRYGIYSFQKKYPNKDIRDIVKQENNRIIRTIDVDLFMILYIRNPRYMFITPMPILTTNLRRNPSIWLV